MSNCDLCSLCLTLNYRALTGIKAWVCRRNLFPDFCFQVLCAVPGTVPVFSYLWTGWGLCSARFTLSLSSRHHWVKPYVRGHIQWPRNFNKPTNDLGFAINLVAKFLPITYAISYQSTKIKLSILILLVGASHPHIKWDNISITRCFSGQDYDKDIRL